MRDRFASQAIFVGLLCLGLASPPALAAPGPPGPPAFVCRVECHELTPERAAEVEARARAMLITSAVQLNEATLACDFETVTVSVTADQSTVRIAAPKTGANLSDRLLDTFEQALSRLSAQTLADAVAPPESAREATAGAPEEREPLPPVAQGLAPAPQPSPPSAKVLRPPSERPRFSPTGRAAQYGAELACGAAVEAWSGDAVMGPAAGASYGSHTLSLALRVAALFPLHAAATFRALELSGALGVRWQPTWSAGTHWVVAAGVSSLSATQHEPYEPRGATHVGAGFVDLTLSRPWRFGAWGVAPELGVRLFAAKRSVTLDQDAQLSLPYSAPHFAVTISRRL